MLIHNVHALLPDAGAALHAAELADQQGIVPVEVLLGPLDAGAGHHGREALLVDTDGVLDEREVDEGDLEDVEREIAFKDTLSGDTKLVGLCRTGDRGGGKIPGAFLDDFGSGTEEGFACLMLETETTQPVDVRFDGHWEGVFVDQRPGQDTGQLRGSFVNLRIDHVLSERIPFKPAGQLPHSLYARDSLLKALKRNVDVELVNLAFHPSEVVLLAIDVDTDLRLVFQRVCTVPETGFPGAFALGEMPQRIPGSFRFGS